MRYNDDVMKKQKLYLDTSIISWAIDIRDFEKHELTKALFKEIRAGKYEIFVSEVVIEEIAKTPENKVRNRLIEFTNSLDMETPLVVTDEIIDLTERYLNDKIIPMTHRDDALHVAICTVNNLDVLVSWNFKHLVKHKTRMEVFGVNTMMGYKIIDICSPKEVVENA
jgi:predicted nucleic acid-binding protein